MAADPANTFVIVDIMRLHPQQPQRYFEIYDSQVGNSEHAWIDVAGQIAGEGNTEEAASMLAWYHNKYGLREGMEFFLQLLYRSRQFGKYTEIFASCCEGAKKADGHEYDFSTMAYLLLAASYLMSHEFDAAQQVCNLLLAAPPSPDNIDDHIRWKGIQVTLSFIRNLAKDENPAINQPGFDPVCFQIGVS